MRNPSATLAVGDGNSGSKMSVRHSFHHLWNPLKTESLITSENKQNKMNELGEFICNKLIFISEEQTWISRVPSV